MLKISFWLKKPGSEKDNLEYITIANPKKVKVKDDTWKSRYACEVYFSEMKNPHPPIYGTNSIDTFKLTLELAKIHLQGLIAGGYAISEVESREPWKLEKGKSLSEQINEIKNNKDISTEDKQKILGILKETFGKIPHMKDKFNI